jgi:hypothetical protein
MELERFGRLLVMHGADLRDWPEADRREAELLLAWSSEAMRLRDEAARIDTVLRAAGPTVSPAAVERVLAKLDGIPDDLVSPGDGFLAALPPPMRRPWIPAALLVSMMVIGFVIGGGVAAVQTGQGSDFVDLLVNRSMAGFDL